jgi:hypothetical protein
VKIGIVAYKSGWREYFLTMDRFYIKTIVNKKKKET